MLRSGLLLKTVVLLALVFAAAVLAVKGLYAPWLADRVRDDLETVAGEFRERTEEVMVRRARHLAETNRRRLVDLPFELTEGDAALTRERVDEYARSFGGEHAGNAVVVARVIGERMREETRARGEAFREEFEGEALAGLLVLLGGLLLLVGIALGRAVLVPLRRLSAATERIAGGDLGHEVGLRGRDEVGRLGGAFDRMTVRLRESRGEIEELNRTLAKKVREKTAALEERNAELAEANERLRESLAELKATQAALVHSGIAPPHARAPPRGRRRPPPAPPPPAPPAWRTSSTTSSAGSSAPRRTPARRRTRRRCASRSP